MKKLLIRLLLDYVEGVPHWQIARELGLTPANLSRMAAGITTRRSSLEKAGSYLSTCLGVDLDTALLQVEVDAEALIEAARIILQRRMAAA